MLHPTSGSEHAELTQELERLLADAAVARERLSSVLAAVRALKQSLPAPIPTAAAEPAPRS